MAAELVGGAFLSALLQTLFEKLASQEVVHFFRRKKLNEGLLKRLKTTFLSVNILLNDAEEKQIRNPAVKAWLDELIEATYDVEDLMSEIKTEQESGFGSSSSQVLMNMKLSPSFMIDKSLIEPKIEDILERLKVIIEQKDILDLKASIRNRYSQRLPAPLAQESSVYGRDGDREAIVNLLLSDNVSTGSDNISVIPIVGMGGIGKTTLAQLVFDDESVKKHFELKVWVTVSDEFDIFKITRMILEKVTSEKCEIEDLYELQVKLKEALMGKKFLIVHDDVWNENYALWDVLKSPFEFGARGSKIIVTTRNKIVASKMGNVPAYDLQVISDEDCWRLFSKHAFNNIDSNEHSDLLIMGREIVKKCKGLPLAVKSLAGLLRSVLNPEEWRRILKSDIWELQLQENDNNNVLPALWLSYYYLPSHLKRCFVYSSVFPKDYEFEKEKIVLMWMAEGLLQPDTGKVMEKVGEEYFDALMSRSLFQRSGQDESTFLMHDLVHDLAIFLAGKFSSRLDDDNLHNLAGEIRHFSCKKGIYDLQRFEGLSKVKSLRTFLAIPSLTLDRISSSENHLIFSERFFMGGGCLRVLSLSHALIKKLPDSISNLKHLRYLDLSFTEVVELTESLCTLFNLQTLLLSNCRNLTQLPTNMGSLTNLRHLDIADTPITEMPPLICNMKDLQTLPYFVLSGEHGGSRIKELRELKHLHGTLVIAGLENIVNVEHVLEANLKDKECLSALGLKWQYGATDDSQKERTILDGLQPHAKLKNLYISGYKGTNFSSWIGDHSFSDMVEVHLLNCKSCCFLPPFGQLPSLRKLQILAFDGVVTIGSEFYSSGSLVTKPFRSLEILDFRFMSELEEWSFIEVEEGGVFPRLRELYLEGCPKLNVQLPDYLPSLTMLQVWRCRRLMPLLPRPDLKMDTAFPCLSTMDIYMCPEQESFLEGGFSSSVTSLQIFNCNKLESLSSKGFQGLTSLEQLVIGRCQELKCLPDEGLPNSLSYLCISDCPLLQPHCQRNEGRDWTKIAHIPRIEIDWELI